MILQFNHILLAIYFFVLLVVTFLIHQFLFKKSTKYNIRKANLNGIRWSSQTKPVSGGITFFVSLLISAIAYLLYQDNILSIEPKYIYIGIVLAISFLMGLADDMISTSPLLKLAIQVACAVILIRGGVFIEISSNFYFNIFFTIFWITSIMNSINMLDNMDAITSTISITVIIGLICQNILIGGRELDLIIFLALFASLLTFMKFNWHPAKMYMGDSGSQMLGAFLGTFSIIYFWNSPVNINIHPSVFHVFVIFLIFLIPIIDTSTVTINRLLKKKSPFVGGRDHTTHFLSYRGISEPKIARLYFLINIISVGLSILILNTNEQISFWLCVFSLIYGIFALFILYVNTRITKPVEIEKD
ncbi:MAG: undecaprenyl/decaprenyl-phosphate alpha-N-acetylglucosaminyl 1-phosphate transferase [Bacteroidia bacterium]|nr:undecaprenyl/decaprenyl-phosphate alpha-N-acetylglucosaminyl 1-phosphate transferase [Bacteroidia bacterium]